MIEERSRRAAAAPDAPLPAVGDIDVLTGQPLSEVEVEYRLRIHQEGNFIALDADYAVHRAAIHQPLAEDEYVHIVEDGWSLERPNTALQLPLPIPVREQTSQDSVVELLRHFVGEFPARVMHLLFEVANDPPFYRRPDITVSINDVLDRLGYARDSRGVHYSVNRKRLTRTLQALYLTHVELYQRRGRTTNGFTAPLLSALGFSTTNEDARNMSIREVFARGLPDVIRITINPEWYRGVRRIDGRPGSHYQLLPRATIEHGVRKRGAPRGRAQARSGRSVDNLRIYVQRCQASTQSRQAEIALPSLLQEAGITNRNQSQAAITLRRALDKLIEEGVLSAHRQVQRGATAVMELRW